MVENGFQRHEAQTFVAPVQYVFEEPAVFMGATSVEIAEKPDLKALPKEVAGKVLFDEEKSVITFQGEMQESDKQALETLSLSINKDFKISDALKNF